MKTINQFFESYAQKYSGNIMMWEKTGNTWISSTYKEIQQQVHYFAAGLLSLGLKKGDRVSLISEGRNAWVISELGILYTGAVNVPLSVKLIEGSDLKFRISHSGSRMVIVSGGQARKLENIKKELDTVEKFIYLDPRDKYDANEISFSDVTEEGKKYLEKNRSQFDKVWQDVQTGDVANI